MGNSSLGTLLVEDGLLTESDRRLIRRGCGANGAFARGVLALGLLDEDELAAFIAEKTRWRIAGREALRHPAREAIGLIDLPLIERLEVVPLKLEGGKLHVAMLDPLDADTVRQIEFFTGHAVRPVIATLSQIRAGITALHKGYKPLRSSFEEFLTHHASAASRRQRLATGAGATRGPAPAASAPTSRREAPAPRAAAAPAAAAPALPPLELDAALEYPEAVTAAELPFDDGAPLAPPPAAAPDGDLDLEDEPLAAPSGGRPSGAAALSADAAAAALGEGDLDGFDPDASLDDLEGGGGGNAAGLDLAGLEGLDDLEGGDGAASAQGAAAAGPTGEELPPEPEGPLSDFGDLDDLGAGAGGAAAGAAELEALDETLAAASPTPTATPFAEKVASLSATPLEGDDDLLDALAGEPTPLEEPGGDATATSGTDAALEGGDGAPDPDELFAALDDGAAAAGVEDEFEPAPAKKAPRAPATGVEDELGLGGEALSDELAPGGDDALGLGGEALSDELTPGGDDALGLGGETLPDELTPAGGDDDALDALAAPFAGGDDDLGGLEGELGPATSEASKLADGGGAAKRAELGDEATELGALGELADLSELEGAGPGAGDTGPLDLEAALTSPAADGASESAADGWTAADEDELFGAGSSGEGREVEAVGGDTLGDDAALAGDLLDDDAALSADLLDDTAPSKATPAAARDDLFGDELEAHADGSEPTLAADDDPLAGLGAQSADAATLGDVLVAPSGDASDDPLAGLSAAPLAAAERHAADLNQALVAASLATSAEDVLARAWPGLAAAGVQGAWLARVTGAGPSARLVPLAACAAAGKADLKALAPSGPAVARHTSALERGANVLPAAAVAGTPIAAWATPPHALLAVTSPSADAAEAPTLTLLLRWTPEAASEPALTALLVDLVRAGARRAARTS
jgi:hypothetical protein